MHLKRFPGKGEVLYVLIHQYEIRMGMMVRGETGKNGLSRAFLGLQKNLYFILRLMMRILSKKPKWSD